MKKKYPYKVKDIKKEWINLKIHTSQMDLSKLRTSYPIKLFNPVVIWM